MKDNKVAATCGGFGFTELLTVAFIVLKLCGIIKWSWFWVLSPILFSLAFAILVLIIAVIVIIVENKKH